MMPPGLIGQAHMLAKETKNDKMAMVYTGLAVTVMAVMAIREIRDMLKEKKQYHKDFHEQGWREREHERHAGRGHGREA